MAKVNFYLKGAISEKQIREAKASGKEINLKKELQIFLMVSSGGRRVQVYTKKRIAQLNWNSEKQVVRCTKGLEGCNELQEWLAKVKAEVIRKCNDLESNGESITKQDLDAYLNKKTLQKVQTVDFEDYLNDFIQSYKTIAGYSLKPNTVKKYKGLGQHVKDFCSANDQAFSLQIINQGFIERFKAFLAQELELSDNTVTKYVKALKTFAKYLIEKELIRTINLHKIRVTERKEKYMYSQ